jgi:hypothetical protein
MDRNPLFLLVHLYKEDNMLVPTLSQADMFSSPEIRTCMLCEVKDCRSILLRLVIIGDIPIWALESQNDVCYPNGEPHVIYQIEFQCSMNILNSEESIPVFTDLNSSCSINAAFKRYLSYQGGNLCDRLPDMIGELWAFISSPNECLYLNCRHICL